MVSQKINRTIEKTIAVKLIEAFLAGNISSSKLIDKIIEHAEIHDGNNTVNELEALTRKALANNRLYRLNQHLG